MPSPRELVWKTLELDSPTRIPRHLWVLPWAQDHYPRELESIQQRYPDDIVTSPGFLAENPASSGSQYDVGSFTDEWGCSFYNVQRGVIGEVKEPLVKTWEELEKVSPPVECLTVDKDQVNAFCRDTEKFVLGGCCPRPFERMQFLRRSDQLYLDLAEQPVEFYDLIHIVHQFYLTELEVWASTEVDGLQFMDDWGSNRSLLISPRLWRSIFKPLYKEYIEIAHARGKKAFMHSDGYTAAIIPDLIEIRLDALNTQLFTMDIEALGNQFGGKITFWGELDRQHLLPFGALADIDTAVRRVYDAFWKNGGAIAQCEFSAGSRPENVSRMFEAWDQLVGK